MTYKLVITERAEKLLDNSISYLLYKFKSEQAAKHVLDEMEIIYSRLEENPLQFADCQDSLLLNKNYKEALIPNMNYVVVFRIDEVKKIVYIVGFFHQLENYSKKV